MLEVGRLCVKIAGREAGKVCCVVKKIDENFVIITGPREATGIKRRRCNVTHLEPLKEKITITADAQDADIMALYEKDKIISKLKIKIPVKRAPKTETLKPVKDKKEKKKESKKPAKKEEKKTPKK